jgi:hypothetical protein
LWKVGDKRGVKGSKRDKRRVKGILKEYFQSAMIQFSETVWRALTPLGGFSMP